MPALQFLILEQPHTCQFKLQHPEEPAGPPSIYSLTNNRPEKNTSFRQEGACVYIASAVAAGPSNRHCSCACSVHSSPLLLCLLSVQTVTGPLPALCTARHCSSVCSLHSSHWQVKP